ncbi:MAG: hypothetical protein U1D30_18175 [Planctomycetota bacterium]
MDKDAIEKFIRELDQAVPRDGAQVRLEQAESGLEESVLSANSPGYLRLGIELLKAGIAPEPNGEASKPSIEEKASEEVAKSPEPEEEEDAEPEEEPENLAELSVDLEYLYTPDSAIRFTTFRRGELKVASEAQKGFPLDRLLTVGCFFFAAILAFFAIIGASEVLGWLKR